MKQEPVRTDSRAMAVRIQATTTSSARPRPRRASERSSETAARHAAEALRLPERLHQLLQGAMRAAPDPPTPASAAPIPGPSPRARRRGEPCPQRPPHRTAWRLLSAPAAVARRTQALAPENRPRGRHPRRPLSKCLCVRLWHRLGHTYWCQGSLNTIFLKSEASSGCVAVCMFDSRCRVFTPRQPLLPGHELGAGMRPRPIGCASVTGERLLCPV